MDGLLDEFLAETAEMLDEVGVKLGGLEHSTTAGAVRAQIQRFLHTVKGTCGFLGLGRLEALAHAAETLVERCHSEAPPPQAITLIAETMGRIDKLLQAIGEDGGEPDGRDDDLIFHLLAVASRPWTAGKGAADADAADNIPCALGRCPIDSAPLSFGPLAPIAAALASSCADLSDSLLPLDLARWTEPMDGLCAAAGELQRAIVGDHTRPIGHAWRSIPTIVRDLSRKLGKKINLELTGADLPLDANALGPLKQALVHLIRNCADHGLEPAEQRLAAGKREAGRIIVSAQAEAGQLVIEVSDDGRGLNASEIGAAALDHGIANAGQLAVMDARQIQQLIFSAGLSTASQVTKISGRGIGMDVVRSKVAEMGGRLAVRSELGEGTTITIRLPGAIGLGDRARDGTFRTAETGVGRRDRRLIAA